MRILVHLLFLIVLVHRSTQGQVIDEPDDVTVCEGKEAVFTCVLNSNIRSDEVQWYRFIKDNSTTVMVDPDGDNINFDTEKNDENTSSSLTITNVIKSYTGYFWVETPSFNVCNASLTVLTSPSVLSVSLKENIESLSVDLQWDAVNDSLTTTYTVTWDSAESSLEVMTLTEQTSYTITGLTLDTVYTITVTAVNMCGNGPEFRTRVSLSTDTTSTTSSTSTASSNIPMNIASTIATSISSITVTTVMINPSTIHSVIVTDSNIPMNIASTTATSISSITVTTVMINPSTIHSVIVTDNKNNSISSTVTSVTTTTAITSAIHTDLPSTSPADATTSDESSNSNILIIAGAAIGGIIVVTIIIVLIIICCWRRKNSKKNHYNDISCDDTPNKNIIPVLLSSYNPNDKHEKPEAESSHQGRIATQHKQSMEYALIDDSKKKELNKDNQQNRETDIQGQPIEYAIAVVDKDKMNSRSEGKQQNKVTDAKYKQPIQYAVVDKSKKKSKKGDKQQNVNDNGASNSPNQNKNNPLINYAVLDTLPTSTDTYITANDNSRTQYALVTQE